MASTHTDVHTLAAAVTQGLAAPLKDILSELRIIARFTSNLRPIDSNLQYFVDLEKNKSAGNHSLNWTDELNKWCTNPDILLLPKTPNYHSTPIASREKYADNVENVFSSIPQ